MNSVETFLKDNQIPYEKHTHATAYTAQGLAQAEHVSGYMVAKPVIVRTGSGFTMCVLTAPQHLDRKRVADVLRESDVRLATEQEMTGLFPGCELGAEPPIGAMFGLRTIADQRIKKDEYLVMQAGTHRDSIRVRREDWEKACHPIMANIALA
jgi:Ala-tRNA(Pro) deacylase